MSDCYWSSHSDADGQAHKAALYEQTLLNNCFYFGAQNFLPTSRAWFHLKWRLEAEKKETRKKNNPAQTKAAFSTNETLLSCHLVTFQQDSNFILLLCLC